MLEREAHGGVRPTEGQGIGSDTEWDEASGRHAVDEDAQHTPIFDALTHSGWRGRQLEPVPAVPIETAVSNDSIDEFRRDPLSAPIPEHTLVPSPEPVPVRPAAELHSTSDTRLGRHHRSRTSLPRAGATR